MQRLYKMRWIQLAILHSPTKKPAYQGLRHTKAIHDVLQPSFTHTQTPST
jgi:hypothetical protein